jgi:hypothetical protein
MRCRSCGAEAAAGAVFCSRCGKKLADGDSTDSTPQAGALFPAANDAASNSPNGTAVSDEKDKDQVLWQGTFSAKDFLGYWILCGVISLALLGGGVLWVRSSSGWLQLMGFVIAPWGFVLLALDYRRLSVRYRLTPQEFVHETGVFRRVNNRVETIDMSDIAFTQTLLQRLTGVGDIRILSSDRSDPDLVLHGIDNVAAVAEIFNNARREERRRRGVHVEQI